MKLFKENMDTWSGHVKEAGANTADYNKGLLKMTDMMAGWQKTIARASGQQWTGEMIDVQAEAAQLQMGGAFQQLYGVQARRTQDIFTAAAARAAGGGGGRFFAGAGGEPPEWVARAGGRGGWFGEEGPMGGGVERTFRYLTGYFNLMRMQRIWGMTGGAALGQIPVAAQQQQIAMQAAYQIGGGMGAPPLGEMAGGMMAYGAQQQVFRGQVGQAAFGAFGWTQQMLGGRGMATAAGIGGPAIGAGAVAGLGAQALFGIPALSVGLPVAAAAGAIGLGVYAEQAVGDRERMALAQARGPWGGGAMGWWEYQMAQGAQAPAMPRGGFGPPMMGQARYGDLAPYGQQIQTGQIAGLPPAGQAAALTEWTRQLREEGEERFAPFAPEAMQQFAGQYGALTPITELGDIPLDLMEQAMVTGQMPQQWGEMAGQIGMPLEQWEQLPQMQREVGQVAFGRGISRYPQYEAMRRWYEPQELLRKMMPTTRRWRGWTETAPPELGQMGYREQQAYQTYMGTVGMMAPHGVEMPPWQPGMMGEAEAAAGQRWAGMQIGAQRQWGVPIAGTPGLCLWLVCRWGFLK
jgi:hypothetical protein